jgi:transcriptional regulator with XRE-family HTH domain
MRAVHANKYRAFLKRLRAARERAALTQVQVAQRLGKPQSYVSKSESGERRVDVVEAADFARFYGIKVDDLVPR